MKMRIIIGLFLILIGLSSLTGLSLSKYFFAIILILIGLRILTGRRHNWFLCQSRNHSVSSTTSNFINEVAVFSSSKKVVKSTNFEGGKTVVVFGESTVDLSGIKTKQKETEIEAVAVFGQLTLILPKDVMVKSEGAGVLGAYTNQTQAKSTSGKTLKVRGAAVFGEVKLLN
jgi:predicted membrane protein